MFLFFLLFSCVIFSEEIDLFPYETSIYSEHGEDGVLAKIISLVPCTSRFCVEFGANDGVTQSNTFLLRRQGWNCLLLDRCFENDEHHLYREFITKENINELFSKYRVSRHLDVLSIDIGYNDFYVWAALDPQFEAKIVIIQCNPTHLPDSDKVVQYRPFYCGDGTNYYGASILALYNLGRSKGYSLVYQESSGENLFFIKDSILEESKVHFKDTNNVEKLYRNRPVSCGVMPRADKKNRKYTSSQEILGL